VAHAFIVFGFKVSTPRSTRLLQNFLITAAALLMLVVVTQLYTKWLANYKANRSADPDKDLFRRFIAKTAEL
jgi:hypothetical protein